VFVAVERGDEARMTALLADGGSLLVDGQCYTPEHARELSRWSQNFDSAVMLSAKAVYIDSAGRHLNSDEPPVWDGPIPESQPTMGYHGEPYQSREGYGANKAEAERVLLSEGRNVSILRPSKIHGPGVRQVREWAIVKRVLDSRGWMPLRDGDRVESTTSAVALAKASLACAVSPAIRVLNLADADPRPARELAQAVATAAGGHLDLVKVDGCDCPAQVGRLPWTVDQVLDTTAATRLGINPDTFEGSIRSEVEWLVASAELTTERGWALPDWIDASQPDYAAEDACLRYSHRLTESAWRCPSST
jgi:nucleoside-diphosphate-sugar epimerase